MSENNNVLLLSSDCIPVKGIKRAIIYDLSKKKYHLIPNDLYDILVDINGKTKNQLYNTYGDDNKIVLDEYFTFLEDNDILLTIDKGILKNFPKIDLTWDFPGDISNAVIDFDTKPNFNVDSVIDELEKLGCFIVELRFFYSVSLSDLVALIDKFEGKDIKRVQLILKHSPLYNIEELDKVIQGCSRISRVFIYNIPEENKKTYSLTKSGKIICLESSHISEKSCGVINPSMHAVNLSLFTESINFNSCLNRKIAIDRNGDIKNCPSMAKAYGNINDVSLMQVLKESDFKDKWAITKDKIDTCKRCEFRYACTDCRAYLNNPNDDYSKPLKCGYNPETCEWEEWSSNPLKQKTIEHYGLGLLMK
ncbi:MAG: grasp-with-spasm system SPASM domain peptide maturase [Flavipsychrobacter sp.]